MVRRLQKNSVNYTLDILGAATPTSPQGLLLILCLEITPGMIKILYGMQGIKLGSATCKTEN